MGVANDDAHAQYLACKVNGWWLLQQWLLQQWPLHPTVFRQVTGVVAPRTPSPKVLSHNVALCGLVVALLGT
jgi:hypothetical protein